MRFALPLGLFVVVVIFLAVGLTRDPRHVPSPLIGKPAPQFALQTLHPPPREVTRADLPNRPFLLNVWASWCVACRVEHPVLVELADTGAVELVGLNYKDARDDALAWLAQRGDPYAFSVHDSDGALGLDLGVYGVPETFVIDAGGVIRYKHIGPVDADVVERELKPLLARLSAGGN